MSEYSQYEIPKSDEMINFSVGQPSNKLLGIDIVKKSLLNLNKSEYFNSPEILQYSNIMGIPKVRKNLSKWLNGKIKKKIDYLKEFENYHDIDLVAEQSIDEKNLMIINGITGGIQMLIETFYISDEVILVEESTYFIMKDIFRDLGIKVVHIKDDDNFESLVNQLLYLCENQTMVFLYMIPFFHNPTGRTINYEIIEKLKNIFDVYDNFYVLSDEVYYFLNWKNNNNILPLAYYHRNFISIGSFSKIIGPSLRIGYILSYNEEFFEEFEYNSVLKSSGGNTVFSSLIISSIIEENKLDNHIEFINNELRLKHDLLIKELQNANDELNQIGINLKFVIPDGGYFVMITIENKNIDKSENNKFMELLIDECRINKVSFLTGDKFYSPDINDLISLRLSFSYYTTEDISLGIKRFVETIKKLEKIRIVLYSGSEEDVKDISNLISNINFIEYSCNVDKSCENIDQIKVSKYNKNVILNLSEGNEIEILIRKILENFNNIEDNKPFIGNIIIISKKIDSIEESDCFKLYCKYNPILFVDSFNKIDLVNKKIKDLLSQLYEDNKINSGSVDECETLINGIDDKLKESLNGKSILNCKLSNIPNFIINIYKKKIGIHYMEYLNNQMYLVNFFGKKYLVVDEKIFCNKMVNFLLNNKSIGNICCVIIDESINNNEIKTISINSGRLSFDYNSVICYSFHRYIKYNEINTKVSLRGCIYDLNIDKSKNIVFMKFPKSIVVKYESTILKIENIFLEYQFLELEKIQIINTRYHCIVINCNSDLSTIESCILYYLKNQIEEISPKNSKVSFVNYIDKENFIVYSLSEINFYLAVSSFESLKDKLNHKCNCIYKIFDNDEITEILLEINKQNEITTVGIQIKDSSSESICL